MGTHVFKMVRRAVEEWLGSVLGSLHCKLRAKEKPAEKTVFM